jgi:hypothetical protein
MRVTSANLSKPCSLAPVTLVPTERPSGCEHFVVSRETCGIVARRGRPRGRPPGTWAAAATFTWSLLLAGCGYHAVYAEGARKALCVEAAPPRVPDFGAVQAALDGARGELSRLGALGSGYPCLKVELLRVEEKATGLHAQGGQPRAAGVAVAVTGRGWVERDRGEGRLSRDTGDVRRVARVEAVPELGADAVRHRRAVRAAAEAVGRALAQHVMGLPVPAREAW